MNKFGYVKKVCGFYISSVHLATMALPYISKQLDFGVQFSTFLEFNLSDNIDMVLSKIILEDSTKINVQGMKWGTSNSYKYSCVVKELEEKLETVTQLNIIIVGSSKYIDATNKNLNKFLDRNSNKIHGKEIYVINCYEVTQFNDNIKEILDLHELIINTSGLHKIEDVFEGYEKIAN